MQRGVVSVRAWMRQILLAASAWSILMGVSGCSMETVQQWMVPYSTQQHEGLAESTPVPQATASVGSREIDLFVEQGPLAPSGKPYGYYDVVQPTYIDGVLLVNKEYALPRNYGSGEDPEAYQALLRLQTGARMAGYSMYMVSGFRSFSYQEELYNDYVAVDGVEKADTYSAWPGHSEHQTGLAFDVGWIDLQFAYTGAGRWLAAHAHEYGFIIRYPKGKEDITGYQYEPWHIRYLGVELATDVYESGLCLEEYLGVA